MSITSAVDDIREIMKVIPEKKLAGNDYCNFLNHADIAYIIHVSDHYKFDVP